MSVYGELFRRVLFPAWDRGVRRRPTLERLRWLEETEWRPWPEIAAQQSADLRALLRHAVAEVPYYREAFAGIRVDEIGSADLARLPLLTRDAARDHWQARISSGGAAIMKSTSGTTGQPLRFGYDRGSEDWRQAVKLRGYAWAGYHLGARSLHYWGGAAGPRAGWKTRAKISLDRALRRERYADCTRRSDEDLLGVVKIIRDWRPDVLVAYTQAAVDLAKFVVSRGLRDWDDLPVLCCAERLFPVDREVLRRAFGDGVFETYGCREVMLIGSECAAHDGLHLSAENLIVEVVVRDGGSERPALPGELGEVVMTDLHNFGMPFIRYVNGDLAVQGSGAACACGRTLPRIASVEGRSTETLHDAAGNRVSGLVFNLIMVPLAERVRQFQAVQHRDRSITLKLVPNAQTLDAGALSTLTAHVEKYLPGLLVRTEVVAEIAASAAGKRAVVVVET